MNNFKFYLTIFFSFFLIFAFSQSKTELVVEGGKDNFNVVLKIDESKDIANVYVKGYNFNKVENQNFEYKYSYKDLFKKKSEQINVHALDLNTDYIYYTISIERTDGNTDYLPSKKLVMPDMKAVLGK